MPRAKTSLGEAASKVEIELTPLIDAVFLLLIFFITTTVLVKTTQLRVELPVAAHYDRLEPEKKLNLRVSAEGELEINGNPTTMGELRSWLESEKMRTGSSTLIVTADAKTPHGFVIDAMEMAVMAGVAKIDLETQEPGKSQKEL
jgi:biopolymer transport protein ExbD